MPEPCKTVRMTSTSSSMSMIKKVNVSVLILTKNEENDLPGCLESVAWADEIIVYDSYSTDRTIMIAESSGARVIQRVFDNWSTHQNWGLENIDFRNKWVFYIDADERVSDELRAAIARVVEVPGSCVAHRVQRRDFLGNTWLKHAQLSSAYVRLFQPVSIRYERLVNPFSRVDGEVGDLEGYLDHYPFSKGLRHWIDRHNSYSTLEAQQILSDRGARSQFSIKNALFASTSHLRRRNQKELFYRLPGRPLIKFLYLYVIRRGFLDGRAGYTYASLQAVYEFFIVLKTREQDQLSG
jgi:glycosyltransferase involved in cell wall biosynthesis